MWTWITHLCRRNRTEPTRSAIAMAALIELNMLELFQPVVGGGQPWWLPRTWFRISCPST